MSKTIRPDETRVGGGWMRWIWLLVFIWCVTQGLAMQEPSVWRLLAWWLMAGVALAGMLTSREDHE